MKIINYFFIAYFISILPANAQLFGGQIKTKNPLINQYPAGSVFCNGPTAIVDVTNPTTGKIWMDRNLGANQVATSSNDENSYGDLYQWGRRSDGHQCRTSPTTSTLSSSDQPGHGDFIIVLTDPRDWRSPQNSNLWQGVNGVNNPCPSGYRLPTQTESVAEFTSWSTQDPAGAFASPLKLPKASRRTTFVNNGVSPEVMGNGFYWCSTASATRSSLLQLSPPSINLNNASGRHGGFSVRCIKDASVIPATIGALNCGSTSITGTLTSGTAASGVSTSVPYTGGNSGSYTAQTISSTGVTGLTATLTSGILSNGAGSLSFAISGTPATSGTASFALTIGGQSCSFTISVSVNLVLAYPAGSVFCASGPTAIVNVTNPTTGKIWMDRNLGATQVATSSTDAASFGDLYQWGRRSDGHQCRISATTTTLSSIDQPPHGNFILAPTMPQDWRSPENVNLWQGVNGVNNPCPSGYRIPTQPELEAERLSWSVNTSVGAFTSPLKLPMAGYRTLAGLFVPVGIIGYYWSSTVITINSRYLHFSSSNAYVSVLARAYGCTVRCIKDASAIPATIGVLNCGSTSVTGTLTNGIAASGVSAVVPYTGGNGGSYATQTISSTGVTSLTATLTSGILANGAGSLSLAITGTPITSGTANFALNIGGQTCNLTISVASNLAAQYPVGSVFCASGPTAIVDIINPTTGKVWMDRNLGANQAATSSTDVNSYGDLYQWGRGNDGHQCRNSTTSTTLSSTDQTGNGQFIIVASLPNDWRSPQNNNLWQGVNGINNPCPTGYRLPTELELNNEMQSWTSASSAGAYASPLKFTLAGDRSALNTGIISNIGQSGRYNSSTVQVNGIGQRHLYFYSGAYIDQNDRQAGQSVRCIKDASAIPPTVGALNCGSSSVTGTLTNGIASSGVSAAVPYNGGNGGSYAAQTLSSTGVAGLTATLTSGNLANGSGSLSFAISGTPSISGSAIFALTLGGQSCSFTISVQPALAVQYPVNSVFCASGPTAIVDVTNPTTGKIWMDRNLGASQAATSSTDTAAYGDLYQWGRRSDGHQCRNSATTSILSNVDQPLHGNHIVAPNSPFDWRSPQNTDLWQGVNGVNNPCPSGYRLPTEVELNVERLSWSSNNSVGAFASPLKFTMAGGRHYNNNLSLVNVGTLGDYYSSTISGTNSRNLVFENGNAYMNSDFRADGDSVRCIKDASAIPATIGVLNCGSTSVTGTLTNGIAASGVSAVVPYTGGNGGSYATQTISSTGVTSLTATLTSGILANGAGSLSLAITGTPITSGTANFALNIGGQTCNLTISVASNLAAQYPVGSVFCASGPTAIVDIINPTTGKVWMDRNLGANQAATSSTDVNSYGDLYQWGRGNDGHQCRTSATTTSLSTSNTPGNSLFILNNSVPVDWRSPQNNNLWQGVNGLNNPCPSGYRLPTENELNAERASWNSDNSIGAFSSPLKFTLAGRRRYQDGALYDIGTWGNVWTSTVDANGLSRGSNYYSSASGMFMDGRASGYSVRCIKN